MSSAWCSVILVSEKNEPLTPSARSAASSYIWALRCAAGNGVGTHTRQQHRLPLGSERLTAYLESAEQPGPEACRPRWLWGGMYGGSKQAVALPPMGQGGTAAPAVNMLVDEADGE